MTAPSVEQALGAADLEARYAAAVRIAARFFYGEDDFETSTKKLEAIGLSLNPKLAFRFWLDTFLPFKSLEDRIEAASKKGPMADILPSMLPDTLKNALRLLPSFRTLKDWEAAAIPAQTDGAPAEVTKSGTEPETPRMLDSAATKINGVQHSCGCDTDGLKVLLENLLDRMEKLEQEVGSEPAA
ncbi:hypothetical protein OC845_004310 [Tilletia horrida]|nr:hypothetical protein OC845_004310 [Tilletia horrida]